MNGPLRVLIADDEAMARRRLLRLVSALPDVAIVGECQSGEEVLSRVRGGDVDVLLLDIQMPGLSGLETKALMSEGQPYVIFTTAHPEHALEAFDVGAVDYVLKPIEAARLAKALERARRYRDTATGEGAADIDRLAVPTSKGVVLLDPQEVSHAVFDGQLVTIHLRGGTILTDMTLQDLAQRLERHAFERVHRRALLNLAHVTRLEPIETGGYVAITAAGQRVEVSRQAARDLRRRLKLR